MIYVRSATRQALCWLIAVVISSGAIAASDDRPSVVTTTAQIADLVQEIGGDTVIVSALMGEGVDPHTYRQSRRDVALLRDADLVIANGLYLEAQLEPLLATLAQRQPVVTLGELINPSSLLHHADYAGKYDPHIWMDVELWIEAAQALQLEMAAIWPQAAPQFASNTEHYVNELIELDGFIETAIGSIPQTSRILITAHDAFRYFARAYDIEVEGIQGLSTESEAGLKRIEELVATLVDRKVAAVFVESSVADRNVKALIEGANAREHAVVIGGSLFSDAMGAPDTYQGTYLGMLDHNATTITRALGGNAPELGLRGMLERDS